MKSKIINRRDFLKLLGVASLAFTKGSRFNFTSPINSPIEDLPNILILVFDALSARHMSLHGYPRETTPNLERFAHRANVYHHHYASGNFTTSGTASLLTGVYPWSHRALHFQGQPLKRYKDQNLFALLADRYHSVAYTHNPFAYVLLHDFRRQINQLIKISDLALYSAMITDPWLNYDYNIASEAELVLLKNEPGPLSSLFLSLLDQLRRQIQTDKLNEVFHKQYPRGVVNCRRGKAGTQCFELKDTFNWLETLVKEVPTPFFGYVHILPPHAPYNPPREYLTFFNENWKPVRKPEHYFTENNTQKKLNAQRQDYDRFIAYVDAVFGRFYDTLGETDFLENTVLVVTSDHGEMFERGILGHETATLYEPILNIPLLISKPGQSKREDIYTTTNAVDVLPTLLRVAGKPLPAWCEGQVLPGFKGSDTTSDRTVYAVEAKQNPKMGPLQKATFAMVKDPYKLIYYSGYPGFDEVYELYNLENDPEELVDLFSSSDPVASALIDELNTKLSQAQGH